MEEGIGPDLLRYPYLMLCGGGSQAALTVETFMKVPVAWGWGVEVVKPEVL